MKTLFALLFAASFYTSSAQTTSVKILDSNVDWQTQNLIVYLSDSTVASATIQLGTELHGSDIFNQAYSIGSSLSVADNLLVIPLTNVAPGVYYVDVRITDTNNTLVEIEYQTAN